MVHSVCQPSVYHSVILEPTLEGVTKIFGLLTRFMLIPCALINSDDFF
jgi:hypothetical protein